ncbi:hypothetical protein SNARM312S_05949 [Streptomyces narbonensis]
MRGNARTVRTRSSPAKDTGTRYEPDGTAAPTDTSRGTVVRAPRSTAACFGSRTAIPFGAFAVIGPRTSPARSPVSSTSTCCAGPPISASVSVRASSSPARGPSANHGTSDRTSGAGPAPLQTTRSASARRPFRSVCVQPEADSPPSARQPSPGTYASTRASVPGAPAVPAPEPVSVRAVITVSASTGRARSSRTVYESGARSVRPAGVRSAPVQAVDSVTARVRNGSRTPAPTVTRLALRASRSGSRRSWACQAAAPSPRAWASSMSTAVSPARPYRESWSSQGPVSSSRVPSAVAASRPGAWRITVNAARSSRAAFSSAAVPAAPPGLVRASQKAAMSGFR